MCVECGTMFLADIPILGHARARSFNQQAHCSGRSTTNSSSAFYYKDRTESQWLLAYPCDLEKGDTYWPGKWPGNQLSVPLSQRGAVMRATNSFLFPKSNKLGVESFHDTYFLWVDFVTFTATALRTTFLADDDLVTAIFCD